MADYYSIITNRGKELEAEALASGRLIVLPHFVVGDSNGKQVKPDPAQIRLINETFRGDIAELVVSPEQSTQLMAKIVLPTGVGGFTVREVGLMTDAGELYAVANCPSIDKPVGGVSVNMQFRLAVSDTSNITLNVATGDGLFLRIDQNLKEIKARGAEAQKTSRESIGVLDGTTQQRGLVQLNSAVNSTSETQAATPAAVKIVMDNANARLAKDRNGGDIPNVALFLQNLGLVETINRAAGSLQKSQNLNDLPDKAQARTALQLGTAATATLTTSTTDDTTGRVLKVGDRGLGKGAIPALRGFDFYQYWFAAGETLFIETNSAINFPPGMPEFANTYVYVNVVGIRDANNDCALLFSRYDTNVSYLVWRKQVGTSRAWQVLKIPATATDIGALPITGGNLRGQLSFLFPAGRGQANCLIANGDANSILACQYGYYQDRFDLHFYDEKGAWESNPLSIGRNGNMTVGGNLSGRAVFEGGIRVYSPNNPPPATDLSAYATRQWVGSQGYATQSWVLQNFVQNIDLTAPTEFQFWDGRGYMRPTDGAAMYNFQMVGGSSNVGYIQIRYTRKQVNNTWYVIN
ncbi:phage tail protein [Escherichia coli]